MSIAGNLRATAVVVALTIVAITLGLASGDGPSGGLGAEGNQLWHESVAGILDDPASDDNLGFAVATGDFNADGFDDLAAGVLGQALEGETRAGSVHVIYGTSDGLASDGSQVWNQASAGVDDMPEELDGFGFALASADFNGDGYADLAIGAPFEDNGAINSGVVHVLYGGDVGLTANGSQLWHQGQADIADEAETDDRFGDALATGDFDGDGYADLAVGVYLEDVEGAVDAGAVAVLHGSAAGITAEGNKLWHQNSLAIDDQAEAGDAFGDAIAAGDFNGDGYDDLAAGVPSEDLGGSLDAGATNVIYGSATGLGPANDQVWHQNLDIADAAELSDAFGSSLAAGDFDGDAYDDLAIGVPGEDLDGAVDGGAVSAIYGSPGGLTTGGDQLWDRTSIGDAPGPVTLDRFGTVLATGDFNGDDASDLVVGMPREDIGDDGGELANAGGAAIIYGSSAGLTDVGSQLWHQSSPGMVDSAEVLDEFASAVTGGDFNGDAFDDLAVGVPEEDVAHDDPPPDSVENAGAVHVLYGGIAASLTGDVDCDKDVDAIDATLLLQFGGGLLPTLACQDAADTNLDGTINAIDATLILQLVAGLLSVLPA